MKKNYLLVFLFAAALILAPWGGAKAFEAKADNSINLAKEEVADGNIYASCQDMTISGTVTGDVVAACKNITIDGTVTGDLISISDNLSINGEIKGSVRSLSQQTTINGTIGHNADLLSTQITLNNGSHVGWDVLFLGTNIKVQGVIDGNLHGMANTSFISGKIGRDVYLSLNNDGDSQSELSISKEAVINGSLTYRSEHEASLESPSSVTGTIKHLSPEKPKADPSKIAWTLFYRLFSVLLLGIIIFSLKKEAWKGMCSKMETKYWASLLAGLAILILTVPLLLLFAFTVIGIPVALIGTALWLIALYVSYAIASYCLGGIVSRNLIKKETHPIMTLGIGLIILIPLGMIPYFGFILTLFLTIWGLGGIALELKDKIRK